VSTNNSGGFASVRSRNFEHLDCGAYAGLELRLRGDGQRYKCIIRADTNWDGIAYCRCVGEACVWGGAGWGGGVGGCYIGAAPPGPPTSAAPALLQLQHPRQRLAQRTQAQAATHSLRRLAARRSFDTAAGEWQTIRLPFSDFFPVFRAKTLKASVAVSRQASTACCQCPATGR
jgi:hypothetical protein